MKTAKKGDIYVTLKDIGSNPVDMVKGTIFKVPKDAAKNSNSVPYPGMIIPVTGAVLSAVRRASRLEKIMYRRGWRNNSHTLNAPETPYFLVDIGNDLSTPDRQHALADICKELGFKELNAGHGYLGYNPVGQPTNFQLEPSGYKGMSFSSILQFIDYVFEYWFIPATDKTIKEPVMENKIDTSKDFCVAINNYTEHTIYWKKCIKEKLPKLSWPGGKYPHPDTYYYGIEKGQSASSAKPWRTDYWLEVEMWSKYYDQTASGREKLEEFPVEGFVEQLSKDLSSYLEHSTRSPYERNAEWNVYIGTAWDATRYWYVKSYSDQTKYDLDQLRHLILTSKTHNNLDFSFELTDDSDFKLYKNDSCIHYDIPCPAIYDGKSKWVNVENGKPYFSMYPLTSRAFTLFSDLDNFFHDNFTRVLKEFPESGFCKSLDEKLLKYLANRDGYGHAPKLVDPSHTGVAWNKSGYWYILEQSSKCDFKLEQLNKFININPFKLNNNGNTKSKTSKNNDVHRTSESSGQQHGERLHFHKRRKQIKNAIRFVGNATSPFSRKAKISKGNVKGRIIIPNNH